MYNSSSYAYPFCCDHNYIDAYTIKLRVLQYISNFNLHAKSCQQFYRDIVA